MWFGGKCVRSMKPGGTIIKISVPIDKVNIGEPYSVMQSDGNSFCGDDVLNSFNIQERRQYLRPKVCKANILGFVL